MSSAAVGVKVNPWANSVLYDVVFGADMVGVTCALIALAIFVRQWNWFPVRHHERGMFMAIVTFYILAALTTTLHMVVYRSDENAIEFTHYCGTLAAYTFFFGLMTCTAFLYCARLYFKLNVAQLAMTAQREQTAFIKKKKMFGFMIRTRGRIRFFNSYQFFVVALGSYFFISLAFNSYDFVYRPTAQAYDVNPVQCIASGPSTIFNVASILIFVIITIAVNISVMGRSDSFRIKATLDWILRTGLITAIFWIIMDVIVTRLVPTAYFEIPSISETASSEYMYAGYIAVAVINISVGVNTLIGVLRMSAVPDQTRGEDIEMEVQMNPVQQLLTCKATQTLFEQYCAGEFCVENVDFCRSASSLLADMAAGDAKTVDVVSRLKVLGKTFIDDTSALQINISATLRDEFDAGLGALEAAAAESKDEIVALEAMVATIKTQRRVSLLLLYPAAKRFRQGAEFAKVSSAFEAELGSQHIIQTTKAKSTLGGTSTTRQGGSASSLNTITRASQHRASSKNDPEADNKPEGFVTIDSQTGSDHV